MAKRPQSAKTTTSDQAASDDAASHAWTPEAMSEALKEAGKRAVELSQNPVARSLLAAGLVTAAAALASNKNVRDATKRNIKEAQEATGSAFDAAADSANRVGAVIINAAIEAVQKMMGAASTAAEAGADAAETAATPAPAAAARPKAPRKPAAAKKPAAPKSTAKAASPAPAKTRAAKPAAPKPVAAKTTVAKTSPSKANGTATTAKPRTRRAKPAGGTTAS